MAQAGTDKPNPLRDQIPFDMPPERWDSLLRAAGKEIGREVEVKPNPDDPDNVIVWLLSGPGVFEGKDGRVVVVIAQPHHLDQWNEYVEEKTSGNHDRQE